MELDSMKTPDDRKMPRSHLTPVKAHPDRATTTKDNFLEIERDVAISWQLRVQRGCYGVYVADTGSTSRSVSRKSPDVALTGQIYANV